MNQNNNKKKEPEEEYKKLELYSFVNKMLNKYDITMENKEEQVMKLVELLLKKIK